MVVLSLFDGISCGRIALERAGLKVDKYYASEIKNTAINVTMEHYPDTIQIGDVTKVHYKDGVLYTERGQFQVGSIDLLMGGSPCQNFSCATTHLHRTDKYGLNGGKSRLFYEYLRLKEEINPKYFLLENVSMKKKSKEELDRYMGVEGIKIDSKLVSFQTRNRTYWTNIPGVIPPTDKHTSFQDFKDTNYEYCKQFKVPNTKSIEQMWNNGMGSKKNNHRACNNITHADKIGCLTLKQDRAPNSGLIEFDGFCRFLTRREIELAQTLPIGYTDSLTYNQMQNVCGDGWTVDVIAHIFSFIPKEDYEN